VGYALAIHLLLQDWYYNAFFVTDTTPNLETSFIKISILMKSPASVQKGHNTRHFVHSY
jgi:hypothetical protein